MFCRKGAAQKAPQILYSKLTTPPKRCWCCSLPFRFWRGVTKSKNFRSYLIELIRVHSLLFWQWQLFYVSYKTKSIPSLRIKFSFHLITLFVYFTKLQKLINTYFIFLLFGQIMFFSRQNLLALGGEDKCITVSNVDGDTIRQVRVTPQGYTITVGV